MSERRLVSWRQLAFIATHADVKVFSCRAYYISATGRIFGKTKCEPITTREAFGRAAEPWEVANVMVFLASDYASYMTGEVVSVSSQHP